MSANPKHLWSKPGRVLAMQLTAATRAQAKEWLGERAWFYDSNGQSELYVETSDGGTPATEGDWIVQAEDCGLSVYSDEDLRQRFTENPLFDNKALTLRDGQMVAVALPEIQPHQQRAIEEERLLTTRMRKLWDFFGSETFPRLDEEEKTLLNLQHAAMSIYGQILRRRIEKFSLNR